ncbi:TPA: iron-containing alcohol dehydrogenase [Candidatus Poribacteria bacterium]|nr:iron-containing alcohol dehydrogenase [Candidatus Poribacteria bacterium]HIA68221.1 iron-containing alcohol dehydrogenase [Candidatus Poribacteria bacterium]HIB92376.1 iron-containing alcohol dehydrogenase [Candidatus Poribacteria bacterium]HIC02180.1 iron-containing alcohol dehydrogenase [Candidatus Poribacteria bacterium]HIN30915.1 iron-containing alcohol dehydrogenase [Candidatus Poribacteria bacterium]
MKKAIFTFPTHIVFGNGTIQTIPKELSKFQIKKALIVADKGLLQAGLIDIVTQQLEIAGVQYAIYDGVQGNPIEQDVYDGVKVYTNNVCDFVIGIGGGSPLDIAKLICLKSTHELPLEEYEDSIGGHKKISSNLPDFMAIPTAAGTGSEVGRSAVVTLESSGRKTVIFSPHLLAKVVIADPELTVGLPRGLTAATGMDALTHNLEAYLAKNFHPICDGIALEGMKLVSENLRRAVEDGTDLEARGNMLVAAMMGAIAFQKGLGVTHSLAHPLSTVSGLHHGLANAIVLPHAMDFNRQVSAGRLVDVASALGVETGSLSLEEGAQAAIDQVLMLCQDVGIPQNLSQVGVEANQIPVLAEQAIQDICHQLNPRVCTLQDMIDIYSAAI